MNLTTNGSTWRSPQRLYLTANGEVVDDKHPKRYELLVAEGGEIPIARAVELGLVEPPTVKAKQRKLPETSASEMEQLRQEPNAEKDAARKAVVDSGLLVSLKAAGHDLIQAIRDGNSEACGNAIARTADLLGEEAPELGFSEDEDAEFEAVKAERDKLKATNETLRSSSDEMAATIKRLEGELRDRSVAAEKAQEQVDDKAVRPVADKALKPGDDKGQSKPQPASGK